MTRENRVYVLIAVVLIAGIAPLVTGIVIQSQKESAQDVDLDELRQQTDKQINRYIAVLTVQGEAFYGQKQWDKALSNYQEILKYDPSNTDAMFQTGLCLYSLDRWDETTEAMRTVIQQGNPKLYQNIIDLK